MRTTILPLIILLCFLDAPSVFCQYTPKYIVAPSEYDCYIIPAATHHVYDVGFGVPALIPNQPSVVTQVGGSLHHACLLDNAGNCYCWGDNTNGEIGNGAVSTTNVPAMYKVATDSLGNPFTNIVQVMPGGSGLGYETAALKGDGTVWIWGATGGGNRGNGQQGGTNTKPVQINFPAGVVIKKIQVDIVGIALDANGNVWTWGANTNYLAPYLLGQGSYSADPTVPHKIALPAPAKDITGGNLWNYAFLTNGSLYGWGFYSAYMGIGNSGFGSEAPAQLVPLLLDAQLGLPHPIVSISVSSVATYAILTDSSLWAWGDNAVGAIGNGQELNFSKYTTSPSPSGGTPNPYNWDWGPGELMQQKPVQIAKGLHSFTNIWASGADAFYCYAEDVNGQLYSWGRGKGAVLGNGIIEAGLGALGSAYPNSWDVPWVTAVNPFALTKTAPTTSPYCVLNPSTSPCNSIAIPVTAPPTVSAGPNQNIMVAGATLTGSATGNGGSSVNSFLWTQVSGPNEPLIVLNTAPVAQLTGLVTGTYVFQLKATDNNWRAGTSTVTIVVNTGAAQPITVNAGANQTITAPASSVTLGGVIGNNGTTILSTSWTETSGPNTAAIASASASSTSVTGLIAGTYTFKLTVNVAGLAAVSGTVTVTVNAPSNLSPGAGAYASVPGIVQAENYASMSGVQTQSTIDVGGGLNVGYIDQGDWMDYNVTPTTAGNYTVEFRVSSALSGAVMQMRNAAGTVLATVDIPTTGNWQIWETVTATISLPAGNQTLQLYDSGPASWNINWMDFESAPATQSGSPALAVPGIVQAEKYATMSGVQTQSTIDGGGGLNVGYIDQGDWMDYNVNVASAGTYTVGFRIATPLSGAILQLKNAAGTVLATVDVPNTGNWQTWQTVNATVSLPAGNQTLQLYDSGPSSWNINWMNFTTSMATAQTVTEENGLAASIGLPGSTIPSLVLYPNPAMGAVTLTINNSHMGKMVVQVINQSGQINRTYNLSKEGQTIDTNLSVSDLPAGVYYIYIRIGDWHDIRKLMKR